MASFWKRLLGVQEVEPPKISFIEEDSPNTLIIDELKKEAISYEINPYDIANSEMMQSVYDSAGKEYYLEVLEDGKIGYNTLESLSKHPIISAIVQTRVNQAAEFAQYSNDDDLGFEIRLRDEKAEPSEADIRKMDEIKRFIQDCGNASEPLDFELTFEGFIRQVVRDSLVFDQCNFEVVRNRRGEVIGFLPVDATTIRRTKLSKEEKLKGRRDPEKPAFCQVIEGKVVAEFGQKDLCFGIRRPRTSMKSKKYGYPELEELLKVIQDLMSAEIYNASNFNNGISANGIIAIKSKMDPKLFRVFRREFYQMLTGVNNAKRTPLIQLDPEGDEDIRSISMGTSNKEMEYNSWVSYLIKVLCSVYQMDPAEIGFVFGSEGQSSALIQADPTARVLMGKEKGLRPLIRSLQSWINKYIVYQIDPRFELSFIGLDSIPMKEKINTEAHRMKYMTVNEIRALHDLDAVEDGDMIAAYYGQLKAKELMANNQKEIVEMKTDAATEAAEVKADTQLQIAAAAKVVMDKNLDDYHDFEEIDLNKKKVDFNDNGIEHPAQYFEGLSEETKRKREKEIERRQRHKEKTGEQIYGPLPGDDEIDKAKQNKGTKSKKADEVREEIKKPGKDEFIRAASKVSGVSKKIIEAVYDRGLGAAATSGHRPGQTPQSWARARVYAFLFDPQSGSRKKSDKDLWEEHLENERKKKSLEKSETYVPPKSVAEEAQRALDAKEKHGDKVKGGTAIGWTRARQLANREGVSEETIRRMKAFFDRHEKNKEVHPDNKDFPWGDNGYTAWIIWGGDEGRRWAEMMVERFDKEKSK